MNKSLLLIITCVFYCSLSFAQSANNQNTKRVIRFKFVARDSVNQPLNEEFDMIEDSCSQIIRYAHLNVNTRKYQGKIKDVSTLNPNVIITEGFYNQQGQKDGYFTTHYLNGQLQAKGNFVKNKYDGKWEVYYGNGKPKLTFEAKGDDITIFDSWDEKGAKLVDNGKGDFKIDMGVLYWQGKLLGGKPDGTWGAVKTNDATGEELVTEKFKAGVFQKGKGPLGTYTNETHMPLLVPDNMLPFTRAEFLRISSVPCGGTKRKSIVNVQYKYGMDAYSEEITRNISNFIFGINVKAYETKFTIEGYINEKGNLTNMVSYDAYFKPIAAGLIANLIRVPALTPATVDGKPVKQKIVFSFVFEQGSYRYTYKFLPVEVK